VGLVQCGGSGRVNAAAIDDRIALSCGGMNSIEGANPTSSSVNLLHPTVSMSNFEVTSKVYELNLFIKKECRNQSISLDSSLT
jgi:hypothetical protein